MKVELREEKEKRVEMLFLFWLKECLLNFEWFLAELMQKMKCRKIEWKEFECLGVLREWQYLFPETVKLKFDLLAFELLMFGLWAKTEFLEGLWWSHKKWGCLFEKFE